MMALNCTTRMTSRCAPSKINKKMHMLTLLAPHIRGTPCVHEKGAHLQYLYYMTLPGPCIPFPHQRLWSVHSPAPLISQPVPAMHALLVPEPAINAQRCARRCWFWRALPCTSVCTTCTMPHAPSTAPPAASSLLAQEFAWCAPCHMRPRPHCWRPRPF